MEVAPPRPKAVTEAAMAPPLMKSAVEPAEGNRLMKACILFSARDARKTLKRGLRSLPNDRARGSRKGTAQHLYEDVYCQRGQMENLIKLHKAQLASDRMSCHNATANQVRLAFLTAAFWLMHCVRSAIPQTNPLARCEFSTLRLIKVAARVIEHSRAFAFSCRRVARREPCSAP
jgi:hypothetical protein